MQHLLLSIVGNTPQVVTETLYAIHAQGKPWPAQIRIITTTVGKRGAMRLIDEKILESLCTELGVPCPAFGENDIRLVPDAQGQPVADARTLDDHEALANFIVTEVRRLTDDRPENRERFIHASLAGGRKTMTFYLGYAMSLFGRAGDCLSHVLVSADYENLPDFFYPTRHGTPIQTKDGRTLKPRDAKVELADIPFIRHRSSLPHLLKTPSADKVDFRELIDWINLGENPGQIRVTLHTQAQCLEITDASGKLRKMVQPKPLEFAFYQTLARATLEKQTDITRPNSKGDLGLSKSFCDELLKIQQLPAGDTLGKSIETLKNNWKEEQGVIKENTFTSLAQGIRNSWFDQRINTLKGLLEEQLPHSVTIHLLPRNIWNKNRERLEPGKMTRSMGYGIPLDETQIRILDPQ